MPSEWKREECDDGKEEEENEEDEEDEEDGHPLSSRTPVTANGWRLRPRHLTFNVDHYLPHIDMAL